MRRLAALAIAIALAWVVVAGTAVPGGGHSPAFALGVALVAAAIVGWLFELAHLPRITGYIAFGLVCGPYVANIITRPMAQDLQLANGLAIVIIAFTTGLQLNFARLRARLRPIAITGGVTLAVTWTLLFAALFAAWPWLPLGPELGGVARAAAAALAATILAGVSPTVTIAIIADSRARGPLADLAVPLVVLIELGVILGFAVCLEAARAAFGAPAAWGWRIVAGSGWVLGGSVAFGAIAGSLFAVYLRVVGREVTVVLLALFVVLLGAGTRLGLEPLLAGLAAGLVVQNVMTPAGDVLRDAIERGARPVLVLFFAAAGAALHVEALAMIGLVALGVGAYRLVLVRTGAKLGTALAGLRTPEAGLIWRALMSTAGVTLGLAVLVAADFPGWGGRLHTLVVAMIALHELAGPILFRSALAQAGEVGRLDAGLVVVSNREPWIHDRMPDGSIRARHAPGGVSVALDALLRERGGVWIAHGAGSADRDVVDARDSIAVPPDAPRYRLRRVWLTPEEEAGYYVGFANSALWPLCHQAHVRPVFKADDWDVYRAVNARFADIVAQEAPADASVFLNDYHLALAARYLREHRPLLRTALFWHIPWPDPDRLRICPWRRDLVEGLLANDLVAFQLPRDQRHFLLAAIEDAGASVSGETVYAGDRPVRVVSIPIGADFDRITAIVADEALPARMRELSDELGLEGRVIGVGVDRLDYTKGIPERLAAIDRVLTEREELRSRFVFVQIGVPSRSVVPGYAEISAEIDDEVARLNAKHGRGPADGPIRYLKRSFPLTDLVALYRVADFCVVSSLHDGMNLVAKEFVAARDDLDGVLVLSELAGASEELGEALVINPYDDRGFAAAIARAIDMPAWERRRRMQALRRRVSGRDVLSWASDILGRLERRKGTGFLSG